MLNRVAIFIAFLGLTLSYRAQDSSSFVFVECTRNRLDLFVHCGYGTKLNDFQLRGSLGLGINRTFSQQRFFPRFTTGISYDLMQRYGSFLGPEFLCSASTLRINQLSGKNHYWFEYMLGFRYSTPGKIRFNAGLSAGWLTELLDSQLDGKYMLVGNWGYEFSMGLGYAW